MRAAAVCYRLSGENVEILLVRTKREGRWTFPKGTFEDRKHRDRTLRDAAARESKEEAGVTGDLRDEPLGEYRFGGGSETAKGKRVTAYLLEVTSQRPPETETFRTPTWFSLEEAGRRLAENREERFAAEHHRILALAREAILRRSSSLLVRHNGSATDG